MSERIGQVAAARRRIRGGTLAIVLTSLLALLCCGGAASAFFLTDLGGEDKDGLLNQSFGCGEDGPIALNAKMPTIKTLSESQIRNAATIINVGAEMNVPPRGWVIAIATALQESTLRNLPHLGKRNDHDSVGLFQQRPSQGWGTPAQLQDPKYASRKFYEKMVKVRDWQTRPLTRVAQAVQRSAYPDAYAKHEPLATEIVNQLADGAARSVISLTGSSGQEQVRCAENGEIAASGWTAPVKSPVWSGFRTASRPGHDGVDLGAGKWTPIRAAAAGRVSLVQCDRASGSRYNCNRDGSPSTPGCGWYSEIQHAGNIITRYCHQIVRPKVEVGQMVAVGEVIGYVGTSGHSSGPHLHFEVHINGNRRASGAIDPVRFMREHGAPLGPDK